jgi:hypothetical protein
LAKTSKNQSIKTRPLGTVVPVGALQGSKSTAGEFPDLVEFVHLCKKMSIGPIQLQVNLVVPQHYQTIGRPPKIEYRRLAARSGIPHILREAKLW